MLNINEITNITELGLIYSLVAVAIFLSFRVLNFSDLTVDASFTLGAAVFATAINSNFNLPSALILSFLSGALAGIATSTLALTLGFGDLLGSILIMYALYSINFRIVGSSNLVINQELLASDSIFFLATFIIVTFLILFTLLKSETGMSLRGVGINSQLLSQYGFPLQRLRFFGIALSNALVALGGALFTLVSGFYDINIGSGTLIAGLASLVIGESISKNISFALILCVLGSVIYRLAIHMGFHSGNFGLIATDLNMITAVMLVGFLLIRRLSRKESYVRV